MCKSIMLLFALLLVCSPSFASARSSTEISSSIQQSCRKGVFLHSVNVHPSTFDWNGHDVAIRECWLERNSTQEHPLLVLSFTIDGKEWKEHYIADKEWKFIELKHTNESSLGSMRFINCFRLSRIWKAIWPLGGAYGNYIHYLAFKSPPPPTLTLTVGTITMHDYRVDPSPNKLQMSDISLQLDLSKKSNSGK